MVNQNLNTMKQPQLGKKISELRRAKGLTQEELVEKCNLNVRTIQRIEAGEVTPRSYTVKALFEALEVEWNDEKNEQTEIFKQDLPKSLIRIINISFVSGILYFLTSIVEFPIDMVMMGGSEEIDFVFYFPIKLTSLICYSVFMIALIKIAAYSKNLLLQVATWIMIVVSFIGTFIQIFFVFLSGIPFDPILAVPFVASTGVVYLIFGSSFLKFESPWKSIIGPLGVLGMVTGFLFITVFGAILGAATEVVFDIGLIYFLSWFVKKYGRISSPDFNTEHVTA